MGRDPKADGIVIARATREDAPAIHLLLRALSRALDRPHDVRSTPDDIARYGFGPSPVFETVMARRAGTPVGLALFFYEFSTWRGCPGVYIQDLYVDDTLRGSGLGRKLLAAVAAMQPSGKRPTCGSRWTSAMTKASASTDASASPRQRADARAGGCAFLGAGEPMRAVLAALAIFVLLGRARGSRAGPETDQGSADDYYYREMYLPQLTSGPSAAAWSPDGKSLVYSMAGSLWKQRVDSTTAEELTDGPGYDYQPTGRPTATTIVFVRYLHDALELVALDLKSGAVTQWTHGGDVNLEPRWSPDGARIAFVSTKGTGHFHIFIGRPAKTGFAAAPCRRSARAKSRAITTAPSTRN